MSINLQKGQTINLDKNQYDLSQVTIGLGWDVNDSGGDDYDLDAFIFLLNAAGKFHDEKDLISFGNLKHFSGHIWHTGDNLTGEGEGDDEQLVVKLNSLDQSYSKVIVAVNIYKGSERNQHFGKIKNSFVRAVDKNGKEIAKYNLQGSEYSGKTAMVFAEIYRKDGGWKFRALGNGLMADYVNDVISTYR